MQHKKKDEVAKNIFLNDDDREVVAKISKWLAAKNDHRCTKTTFIIRLALLNFIENEKIR